MRYSWILYGEKAVDNAGKDVLGYPGLWATHPFEGKKIYEHLKGESNNA